MSEEEFINPIDPDKITETPGTLPYAHHTGSALVKPEDKGKLKGLALSAMEYQTDMQMDQIYEQMKLLSDQANRLQDRKRISEYIYQAEMRFQPIINHTYYLYEKEDGSYFLSLIGPNDWGRSGDIFNYIATTKLLADHTWDVLNKSQEL